MNYNILYKYYIVYEKMVHVFVPFLLSNYIRY